MLFNSYEFVLVFLPLTFLGFFWIARHSHISAAFWLSIASLAFYGWWDFRFVPLLFASISFNYAIGRAIACARDDNRSKALLIIAVAINLAVLGTFKYTNFFISTFNQLSNVTLPHADILLPLGISFFTFTQITFLVDVHRGIAREYDFVHYLLFVTYFPHLIAGPVLHHKQMMPQFQSTQTFLPSAEKVALGLVIFAIGLAKKVFLADTFGAYASPIFDGVRDGIEPTFVTAWAGTLAYTLQLYFDFSGYSDMAIGLSKLFGVDLPQNFSSPYKAANISDFWRRWHMTLSRFLRDYLYIPLGGNRHGAARRYMSLAVTMLLGGLWHGASWTFVAWGALHGLYLAVNHAWQALCVSGARQIKEPSATHRLIGIGFTFLAVVVAWVFFRADNFTVAIAFLKAMFAVGNSRATFGSLGFDTFETVFGKYMVPIVSWNYLIGLLVFGHALVFVAPNTQQIAARILPAVRSSRYNVIGASLAVIFAFAAISASRGTSEFIYFNF